MASQRVVAWFSAGAASAVAAKLTLVQHGCDAVVVYIDTGSEHPDNARFIADCERWFRQPVRRLKSERYRDTWQLWEERRFLIGPRGALCTAELKKVPRFDFQQPDDIQVFGYTVEEQARADQFRRQNFDVRLSTPLIHAGLTKADCLAMIDRAGIEVPAMYRLGFQNNNCIGCVKGGMGYWNHIRRHFPETFDRMSKLERQIGHSVCSERDGTPIWLDELAPDRGDVVSEPAFECSIFCHLAEQTLETA